MGVDRRAPAEAPARRAALLATLAVAFAAQAQDSGDAIDNGTNPARMSAQLALSAEYNDIGPGLHYNILEAFYQVPLGARKDYALRLRLPVQASNVLGQAGYALGDAGVQIKHVFGLTRERAFVAQGELIFNTAKRPELGTGKQVLKGTFIYVNFLQDGAIFAPAAVHSVSLGGDASRSRVNITTLDFYYVPRLAERMNFMTLDPALNFDWESARTYPSLTVTLGRVLGPAWLGGRSQVYVKPSLLMGGERPARWGVEAGYKVIGF